MPRVFVTSIIAPGLIVRERAAVPFRCGCPSDPKALQRIAFMCKLLCYDFRGTAFGPDVLPVVAFGVALSKLLDADRVLWTGLEVSHNLV